MIRFICRALLKLWGFKYTGNFGTDIPKKIFVVYPHTSNWDFPLGILLKGAIPLDVNYVGKDSLFRWPWGWLFRWLGGIPVDRSRSTNFVDSMAALFGKYDRLAFAIAPEGTRKRVRKFKSGFYYIALKAGIPLILVKFDFGKKEVHFSEPFMPSGDYAADLRQIIEYFRGTQGIHPELACQWEDENI
jgi:1-acyl-sn-glycerol-3-phosphate acyltransferase